MSIPLEELRSLVKQSVAEALSSRPDFECKNCGYTTKDVDHYINHKVGELGSGYDALNEKIDKLTARDPEALVKECEGPLCELIKRTVKEEIVGRQEETGEEKDEYRLF